MGEIAGALTAEETSVLAFTRIQKWGCSLALERAGTHSLFFFPLRITQLALPHCFVLFLEVAEPAIRQSGIKKKPILSLAHVSGGRCFSFLKDCEGPSVST